VLNARKDSTDRSPRRERRLLQDESRYPGSLLCSICPDRALCGGLNIGVPSISCLDNCCGGKDSCDVVCCRNNKKFVEHVREIDGFDLANVPRAPAFPPPKLPSLLPVFFHGNMRANAFDAGPVCLPFFRIVGEGGHLKCPNESSLRRRFHLGADIPIILSATAKDHAIEAWWNLGFTQKREIILALRDLGVVAVTTPNYSLFTCQPRWDDMHSMKRIAISWEEFQNAGMPAALHLNAATERDSERWAEFAAERPEVVTIAFEFGTGAGRGERRTLHAQRLVRIAQHVGRPMQLLVRGALDQFGVLRAGFQDVSLLDTAAFMKTMHRQRAVVINGSMTWRSAATPKGQPLDDLLAHNISAIREILV